MKINDTFSDFVMNREEARKLALETDKKTIFSDFIIDKKSRIIAISHGDGSYLEFHSACFKKLNKEWLAVFTEHHGIYLYHIDDIKNIKELSSSILLYSNKDFN